MLLLFQVQHLQPGCLDCDAFSCCSVKDLYNNLEPAQADSLTGPAGAARLKAAGYTAVAVQAGAEGKITMWDLKLAGYMPADDNGSTAPAADAGPPRTPRLGLPGSSGSSNNGAVTTSAVAGAAGVQAKDGAGVTAPSGNGGHLLPAGGQQGPAVLKADGPWDVEYFRHQIKPLMHMQPGGDIPDLLLGTKVGTVGCSCQPYTLRIVAMKLPMKLPEM